MENLIAHAVGFFGLLYMAVGFGITSIDCIADIIVTRKARHAR